MNSQDYMIEKIKNDIILTPKVGHDSTLIFMHGLGDSAMGYIDIFLKIKPVPLKTKVVLLTADVSSVTINGGAVMNSWYDILSFDKEDEESISESDVISSTKRIVTEIEKEAKTLNDDYSKIFLGGFSQGSCMSLHVGLTFQHNLGGLVCLSGLMFPFTAKQIDYDTKKNLPIFIAHGTYDNVIPKQIAEESYKPLYKNGLSNICYKTYLEDHTISLEEMEDFKLFLEKI